MLLQFSCDTLSTTSPLGSRAGIVPLYGTGGKVLQYPACPAAEFEGF